MEAIDSPDVRTWIQRENAISAPYLQSLAGHAALEERLKALWNYERFTLPEVENGQYFYTRNDGLQNQAVLYVASKLDGTPRVLLDPNTLRADGTVGLARWAVSRDGRYLAWSASDAGSDWTTIHVREVGSGRDLPETLRLVKFTSASWSRSGDGFYYSRYPEGRNAADAAANGDDSKPVTIWFHRLNTPQSADVQVLDLGHPTRDPYATVSDDGHFLIVNVEEGTVANGLYYRELPWGTLEPSAGKLVRLLDQWDALYDYLGNDGRVFYVKTNRDAPLSRIVAMDLDHPEPEHWKTLVPEGKAAMVEASYVGGRLFAQYLQDAHARVAVYDSKGTALADVALPGAAGTVEGFAGRQTDRETFFSYTDFLTPPAVYHYDIANGKVQVYRAPTLNADVSRYVTEQVFYTLKDGTRVPMFLTHRRDLKRDGSNKTLLYGYGGFDISETPTYSPVNIAWLESGGLYAVANLRGGGEYGRGWHEAGTLARKQNVFDDFIAAAEYLIREKYTTRAHLAIHGRSNGGLLVAATLIQRPELFGAAIPEVGVLDMLRYHTASANARQWSTDYGLSENPADFRAQIRYSPVQNVRPGTCYPPTLITTADHDNRVVPWHSYKFAAAMQAAQSCENPILLRVETRAGHGAGMPTWMLIEQAADKLAFLNTALQ